MSKVKELIVDVLHYEGESLEIGKAQGKEILKKTYKIDSDDFNINNSKKVMQKYAPNLFQELVGISKGLRRSINHVMKYFSGYNASFPVMGCTTFANDSFYVRNYDLSPELYDGRFVFSHSKESYASVGFSEHIIGRLDGMNEKGLVVGLHLVNQFVREKGLMATTIVRMILDQCQNVSEAIRLIKGVPHGYCFNFSLLDKEGKVAKVEASPENKVVIEKFPMTCTNHFESEGLKKNNTNNMTDTEKRQRVAKESIRKHLTPLQAYYAFNNEEGQLFFKNYANYFGTLHTVVYIPETLEIIVGIGGNCYPYTFSLQNWLQGAKSNIRRMCGKIVI